MNSSYHFFVFEVFGEKSDQERLASWERVWNLFFGAKEVLTGKGGLRVTDEKAPGGSGRGGVACLFFAILNWASRKRGKVFGRTAVAVASL